MLSLLLANDLHCGVVQGHGDRLARFRLVWMNPPGLRDRSTCSQVDPVTFAQASDRSECNCHVHASGAAIRAAASLCCRLKNQTRREGSQTAFTAGFDHTPSRERICARIARTSASVRFTVALLHPSARFASVIASTVWVDSLKVPSWPDGDRANIEVCLSPSRAWPCGPAREASE